ncbi:MAG: hypothetical protein E4H42_05890 [Chromatiales bacterium]|nr:MAG: hypothetical protein E4H42_05890 [Chromatiales bacterium]
MRIGILIKATLLLTLAGTPACAQQSIDTAASSAAAQPEKSILFVGNSFTYYNNSLHSHLRKLLRAANADGLEHAYLRSLTISGGELPELAAGLQQRLDEQRWDVVILQGYSDGPITHGKAERFRTAARDYVQAIRASGAEPVFFMTWAYTDMPEMTARLDAAYSGIGSELGAQVVPVGRAFARALSQRPELALIIDDKKHPTLAGTYLAACSFYAALYGVSPVGLSYTAGLGDDAIFLQQVAWDTWVDYEDR